MQWMSGVRRDKRLWGAFFAFAIGYVLWLYIISDAPIRPDAGERLWKMTILDGSIDPSVLWVHNIYGMWMWPFACFIIIDQREQTFPGWPFVLVSVVLGFVPIALYFVMRQPKDSFTGPTSKVVRIFEHPIPTIYFFVLSIGLTAFALARGDWSAVAYDWNHDLYIRGCLMDLVLLQLLFPLYLRFDMKKRGMSSKLVFWSATAAWLVGPMLYLLFRKKLDTSEREVPLGHPATS